MALRDDEAARRLTHPLVVSDGHFDGLAAVNKGALTAEPHELVRLVGPLATLDRLVGLTEERLVARDPTLRFVQHARIVARPAGIVDRTPAGSAAVRGSGPNRRWVGHQRCNSTDALVTPAKLHRMDSPHPLRVTLTGDVSGAYVVVEQRSDGSLLVAPDTSSRSRAAPRPSGFGSLLSGLVTPSDKAPLSGVEVLQGWGVELHEEEQIEAFFVADVDESAGFLAITSRRFIFVADTGKGPTVVHEHLLSAARNVELVRRGLRRRLRVSWHGTDSLVGGLDRKALERLQHQLEDRRLP